MSKSTIWTRLKNKGFADEACAAIMGNMQQESAFRSNNVEDRLKSITDEQYTAAVDNGSYSREDFMRDNGNAYGYGLCQWTYPTRKAGLYDYAKARGVSIGDEQMQIDWMMEELHQGEFLSVYRTLTSPTATIDAMTRSFMVTFENPTDKSDSAVNYRISLAKAIYQEFAGTLPEIPADDNAQSGETQQQEEDTPTTPFWFPRMLCRGMVGSDVAVLQALLIAHGYNAGSIDGAFGTTTNNALIAYQAENGLDADGIAGNLTWAALMRR